jgi:hypothetical protein
MQATQDGLEISHRRVMSGFMTFLFSRVIGKNSDKGVSLPLKR